MPYQIVTVVGARPQLVKAAAVSAVLASEEDIRETLIHTGQHFSPEMSGRFLEELELPRPAVNLGIGGGTHGAMTAAMLAALESEFVAREPDLVLVYGDTNSTLAAALAASKLGIPIAHVEAGPRSYNDRHPEEINRRLTDHLGRLLLCPTELARLNLVREGLAERAVVVGDVMLDMVVKWRSRAVAPAMTGPFVLATLHRPGNVDDGQALRANLEALGTCPLPVLLPIHPRTEAALARLDWQPPTSLRIVAPLGYFEILGALQAAAFVVSDSGGLGKEAFFFGKRCLTLLPEPVWPELGEVGAVQVVSSPADLPRWWSWAQEDWTPGGQPFGDGKAAQRIVRILREFLAGA
ncbi:MAG: UDP-N-acetylglucosamine 2-epimerase (non-hydrolyzing) [Magnetospirillum sp. WYHS-4]